jgi:hypothetical protein
MYFLSTATVLIKEAPNKKPASLLLLAAVVVVTGVY